MRASLVIKAMDDKNRFRFNFINSTDLVEEMRKIHDTSTTASAALGRMLTMVAMMSSDIKNDKETVAIKIKGNGPAGLLITDGDAQGNVRAYMENPTIDIPSRKTDNKLDVGKFVGKEGLLSVVRDFGTTEPYIGKTRLVTGEIAEDMASYFFYSEQTPTVVSLGVLVDVDYSIKAAGGLFIQVLPGYEEQDLAELEEALKGLPPISSVIRDDLEGEEFLNQYFENLNLRILEEKKVRYQCSCSQERVNRAMISLGKDQLDEIIDEDHGAEIHCEFCNTKYQFSEEDLEELKKEC